MQFFDLLSNVNEKGEIYASQKLAAGVHHSRHDTFVRIISHELQISNGLEVGAGSCHVGKKLSRLGHSITAVDKYVANSEDEGVRFVEGDCIGLPSDLFKPKSFDWILADNILEHLPRCDNLVKNMVHWLKDGGFVLVSVPNGRTLKRFFSREHRLQLYRPIEHINIFTPHTLDGLFKSYGMCRRGTTFRIQSFFDCMLKASIFGITPFGIYRCYYKVSK